MEKYQAKLKQRIDDMIRFHDVYRHDVSVALSVCFSNDMSVVLSVCL